MDKTSDLTENFVRALRYYISVSGKTKKEIAEAIGVPPTTFSSWSNGKHLPDMEKLQALATYLKAPVSQFYNFTTVTEKPDPLLKELLQAYPQLDNEDKLIIRSLINRVLNLYKDKQ